MGVMGVVFPLGHILHIGSGFRWDKMGDRAHNVVRI